MIKHTRGSYIPWSDGARVCPGEKFAQVEFVALMAAIFKEHRIHVVKKRRRELTGSPESHFEHCGRQ
jgi:cytochrome P450